MSRPWLRLAGGTAVPRTPDPRGATVASAAANEPPVGRTGELGRLRDRLALAHLGNGGLVTVSGPSGIGKSTVLAALQRAAVALPDDPESVPSLAGACTVISTVARRGGLPLAVWSRLTARAAELSGTALRDPASAEDITSAAHLVLDALDALSGTVLIVIDDAQHLGDSTRAVLREVHEGLARRPVLLVLGVQRPTEPGARPFPIPDLEVPLAAFTAAEVVALIAARRPRLAPRDREAIAGRLLGATGGVPIDLVAELAAIPDDVVHDDGSDPATSAVLSDPDIGDAVARAIRRIHANHRPMLVLLAAAADIAPEDAGRRLGVDAGAVRAAIAAAGAQGLTIEQQGVERLHGRAAAAILANIREEERSIIELRLARTLATDPEVPASTVVEHLLRAGRLPEREEVAQAALRAARESQSRLALVQADEFLAIAEEHSDLVVDRARALELTLMRAVLRRETGDLVGMTHLASQAAALAQEHGDADRLAEAALLHAYPPDWRMRSEEAARVLALAEQAAPSPVLLARVLASRASVEMRRAVVVDNDEAWAWETLPHVGRPLAERAVALARSTGDRIAVAEALLAWRSCHRAPHFLEQRRSVGGEALALARRGGGAQLLFDAALRTGLDDLAAADREAFETKRELMRQAAGRSDQRRLRWRLALIDAAAAALDGDLDGVARHRQAALVHGSGQTFAGRSIAQVILTGYELMQRGTLEPVVAAISDDLPVAAHQLASAVVARVVARTGDDERARELLGALRDRPIDEESSILATACEAGRAAIAIGDHATAGWALAILEPFTGQAALDSEGLWPAQPVATVVSQLRCMTGDVAGARRDHETALRVATSLRSRPGLDELTADTAAVRDLDGAASGAGGVAGAGRVAGTGTSAAALRERLTARQLAVLQRLASGLTNEEIAAELRISRATVVREIGTTYRELGAQNRAEAARIAARLGLIGD